MTRSSAKLAGNSPSGEPGQDVAESCEGFSMAVVFFSWVKHLQMDMLHQFYDSYVKLFLEAKGNAGENG